MGYPKLKNKLILAPMADICDLPFRLLCKKYGAAMTYTEQISALAVVHESEKTIEMARTHGSERPCAIQLFGRDPKALVQAAKRFEQDYDVIDLNCGCPAKKIVDQGYGSALMKEEKKLSEIISCMVKSLDKPVSAKIRSGFDNVNAVEIARTLEKAGACAVAVHARTTPQGYSGKADWSVIKAVKDAVSIPVIGNGDVVDPLSAEKMLKETGCDYIMIGRAVMKNPWVFRQILYYFKTGEILEQTDKEKLNMFFEYLEIAEKVKFDVPLTKQKLLAMHFSKGVEKGREIRDKITRIKTEADLKRGFLTDFE